MEFSKWSVFFLLVLLGLIISSKGVPVKHKDTKAAKKSENVAATSRGYIEIDGSDPFNIPKHSKYIKGPTPEFDATKDDKDEKDFNEDSTPQLTREHKDTPPAKELANVDSDESPDLAVDAQKDIEREKALDKVYESPKEEGSPKEEEEISKDENASKGDSEEQPPSASQDDPNAMLSSHDRLELPISAKRIQDIEQMFHTKQTSIVSPSNDPLK